MGKRRGVVSAEEILGFEVPDYDAEGIRARMARGPEVVHLRRPEIVGIVDLKGVLRNEIINPSKKMSRFRPIKPRRKRK